MYTILRFHVKLIILDFIEQYASSSLDYQIKTDSTLPCTTLKSVIIDYLLFLLLCYLNFDHLTNYDYYCTFLLKRSSRRRIRKYFL